jgi:Fe2+ transport system protein FeoA
MIALSDTAAQRTSDKIAAPSALHELPLGGVARVKAVEVAQNAAKRLADMGFVRGAVVEMIRPGRPCLVRIGGTYVGLGVEHQRSIRIDRV